MTQAERLAAFIDTVNAASTPEKKQKIREAMDKSTANRVPLTQRFGLSANFSRADIVYHSTWCDISYICRKSSVHMTAHHSRTRLLALAHMCIELSYIEGRVHLYMRFQKPFEKLPRRQQKMIWRTISLFMRHTCRESEFFWGYFRNRRDLEKLAQMQLSPI